MKEIDPRAGKLEIVHISRLNFDEKRKKTQLELEDCRSDIFDDYNMAVQQEKEVEWKCIKDFDKINLQGL